MNIFGVGIPEIAVIFVLALLIFGPKKLPELGRSIGKTLKVLQQASGEFQKEIEKALNILESPWSRRDEKELKIWFTEELDGIHKAEFLTKKIISSGLEGFIPPKRLNPIDKSEIK